MGKEVFAVSACLAGEKCRYNGKSCAVDSIVEAVKRGEAIAICPECLGGLETPRSPAEIEIGGNAEAVLLANARVISADGLDVTEQYVNGAYKTLSICLEKGIQRAVLKDNSPSCGCEYIYDGSFSGRTVKGMGITAVLLKNNGITVEKG